jgi:hypothetical protein
MDAQLVPIFFANDTDPSVTVAQMTAFYQGLGATSEWGVLKEYGVGVPASVSVVPLSENAPSVIDDSGFGSQLEQWLSGKILSGAVPNNVQGQTVYAINYPSTTTVTSTGPSGPEASCQSFNGYHTDMQLDGGGLVAYVVMPRCPVVPGGLTALQDFTVAASHELMETTTDPYPDYAPAWGNVDQPNLFYDEANSGSEIADMCENDPEAALAPQDFPFAIQRIWSNASANAGHDPCVPNYANEVYFGSVAQLNDKASFVYSGLGSQKTYTVNAVHVATGGSGTVKVSLYSDKQDSNAPWTVQLLDYNSQVLGQSQLLSFSPSSLKGKNGDTLEFRVTVNQASSGASQAPNTELFVIQSTEGAGTSQTIHFGFGLVGN